jgi:hypothetical protein
MAFSMGSRILLLMAVPKGKRGAAPAAKFAKTADV